MIGTGDPELADIKAEPYEVFSPPSNQRIPFVFASPHSGRIYPRSLLRMSRLSALSLRRSEDAYVDSLFADVPRLGAPLVVARFARAWLDANRASTELDLGMFDAPLHVPVAPPGPRVVAGLGVIPRIVRDGAEIYPGKIPACEAENRLHVHKRYHAALACLVRETHARFGAAVVIDCHSMPSAPGSADIVLGDRYGVAAASGLLRLAEAAFQKQGFRVARNVPYAGGYTTHRYGEPKRGIHALQIEICRALYLDEESIEPTNKYPDLRRRLEAAVADIAAVSPDLLRSTDYLPIAAE